MIKWFASVSAGVWGANALGSVTLDLGDDESQQPSEGVSGSLGLEAIRRV